MTRSYQTYKFERKTKDYQKEWNNYCESSKFEDELRKIFKECGIDPNKNYYSIQRYGDAIQNYYQIHWPNKYKIFAL